jgi:hypothetical protein
MELILKFNEDLLWQSDWDGYEVGFEDVLIVGLYQLANTEIYIYIDMENMKILDMWTPYWEVE